jgi:hypothetical protein
VKELSRQLSDVLGRLEAATPQQVASQPGVPSELHVEQLLEALSLGEHDEAERRVNRLFIRLSHDQQRAAVKAMISVAATTGDHTTQLVACSLLEAADRLDPTLTEIQDVEAFARSGDFSLRSSAAVPMWQWAESSPGRVPVSLLAKLALPSVEDWHVHATVRAGAKQLLRCLAARAIFDEMVASADREDRDYAVGDLLQVATVEPRAVPLDLAEMLASEARGSSLPASRSAANAIPASAQLTTCGRPARWP